MEYKVSLEDLAWTIAPEREGHHGARIRYLFNDRTHGTQRIRVMCQEFEPGGYTETRAHPTQEQCYYVLSGQMEVIVLDRTYLCGPGDAVWIPRNADHSNRTLGDVPVRFLTINARFE